MLYFAQVTKDSNIFITSDNFSGEMDFSPYGFWGILETKNQQDSVKFIGDSQPRKGFKLQKFNSAFPPKGPNKEELNCRIWPLHEQLSYFMEEKTYVNLFGPINLTPKVLFFDIEILNRKGQALEIGKDPICMIGVMFNNEITIIDEPTEKETILKFLRMIYKIDPYIICGYFSKAFDVPYILERMKKLGIPFSEFLNRISSDDIPIKYLPAEHPRRINHTIESFAKYRKEGLTPEQAIQLNKNAILEWRSKQDEGGWLPHELTFGFGRVHYDLYESVKLDARAINKTKNRRMKTIAEFYGSKDIVDLSDDVKTDMFTLYNEDKAKLIEYLKSDMRQTSFIFNVYYPLYASQATMGNTTFGYIVQGTGRAPFSKLFIGKIFSENQIYPFMKNIHRNANMFEELTEEGKFRGAYTGIKRTGRFKSISKVDINSMYPSLIITFNISPETVAYLGYENLYTVHEDNVSTKIDKFVIQNGYYPILIEQQTDDYIQILLPDDKVSKYIRFKIDTSKKGLVPSKMDKLLNDRKKVRQEMKDLDESSTAYKVADSLQNNIKISANAVFGIMGNPHFDVGDLSCAMLITGFGRELSHYMTTYLGEGVIEIDTDGLYVDGDIDVDKLNSSITEVLTEKYKKFVIRQAMKLDLEVKDTIGMFLGIKNYVLKKPDGSIETKGSSLKGSSKAPYIEKIINQTAIKLLNYEPIEETRKQITDLMYSTDWKPEDFKQTLAISKDEDEYKIDGGFSAVLNDLFDTLSISDPEQMYKRLKALVEREIGIAIEIQGPNAYTMTSARGEEGKVPEPIANFINQSLKVLKEYAKGTITKESCGEQLLYFAEYSIMLGRPKKEKGKMGVPLRLMKSAKAEGILIMKGETLEYYQSEGEDSLKLFTKDNLKKFPINYSAYRKLADNTVTSMLERIYEQESVSLF